MHVFFLDKNNTFRCRIEIDGAPLENAKARLLLKTEGYSLVFDGKILNSGECTFDLVCPTKIFTIFNFGKLHVEVIVNNILFTPYESEFSIEKTKKIKVDQENKNSSPRVSVVINNKK